jgi:hypothetical protein
MPLQDGRFTGHTNYANIHWPLCIDSREE